MEVLEILTKSSKGFGPISDKAIKDLTLEGLKLDPEYYLYTKFDKSLANLSFQAAPREVKLMDAHITIENGHISSIQGIEGVSIAKISFEDEEANQLKNDSGMNKLHHSFANEGIVIEVDKNTEIDSPLIINHIATSAGVSAPLVFIKLNPFSKMSVIENYTGKVSEYASIAETYVTVLSGAKLEHIQTDIAQDHAIHHGSVYADVSRDATYSHLAFHLEGKVIRKNTTTNLLESGSHTDSYSLFLTDKEEHSDISTVIHHLSADTTSDQISKGILSGNSKGVFTGKIHIHPEAQRVNSGQINRNLLLSPRAQIHSQPQLEIFADDVKCSHGSTTGQMSDEELFYFEARGIRPEKARTLLAHGFALEVVNKIKNTELKNKISELVLNELSNKFNIGG